MFGLTKTPFLVQTIDIPQPSLAVEPTPQSQDHAQVHQPLQRHRAGNAAASWGQIQLVTLHSSSNDFYIIYFAFTFKFNIQYNSFSYFFLQRTYLLSGTHQDIQKLLAIFRYLAFWISVLANLQSSGRFLGSFWE